ncbi:hypothetical protein MMC27_000353 [Xylographa pallens]|nr:hypothetical protein [Xylographa pallens]
MEMPVAASPDTLPEPKAEFEMDSAGAENAQDVLTGFRLSLLFFAVLLVAFLMALSGSILAQATPTITTHFHSLDDVGWYGTAYLLANCSLLPLCGKIYENYSLKYTFVVFVGLFEIGSLLSGTSTSSNMLIFGRAIAGMGGAGIINGAISIITAVAPIHKRPILVGFLMSVSAIGAVTGPLIGGVVTEQVSWRWCFYINVIGGGATMVLILLIRMPTRMSKPKTETSLKSTLIALDLVGFAIFEPACLMFLLAIWWGGVTYPWKSPNIIGLFCGSFVFICLFVAWEYHRGDAAMIPLSIVRQRVVFFSCCTSLLQIGPLTMLTYYLPIWFQAVKGASPTESGIMILATVVAQILFAPIAGILVSRIGYYTPFALFGSVLTTIGTGLYSTFTPSTSTANWIGYQILTGAGRGMAIQQPITATQANLPATQANIGSALVLFFQYLGATLFITFGQTVFISRLGPSLSTFAPSVNASDVMSIGATELRQAFSGAELDEVILAYNQALTQTFYLATAGGAVAFLTSWGLGWKSVKKSKPPVAGV